MIEVEDIFKRLMSSGVKEAVLFKKSGEVLKSSVSREKTLEYMGLSKELLDEFKNVLRGLIRTNATISSISIQTENLVIKLINSENTILFFTIREILDEIEENLDIGKRIDELFD